MNIDFRKEFDILLKDYGIDVFLIRNLKHTRCVCYNTMHKGGAAGCKKCGGTGLVSSIENIKSIIQYADSSSFLKMSEVGLQVTNTFIAYFKHTSHINEGDKLLVVGFDNSNLPVDIKYSCEVKSCKDVRGDSGRIEYTETLIKIKPEDIIKEQKRFNAIPSNIKRAIMGGKKFKWFTN